VFVFTHISSFAHITHVSLANMIAIVIWLSEESTHIVKKSWFGFWCNIQRLFPLTYLIFLKSFRRLAFLFLILRIRLLFSIFILYFLLLSCFLLEILRIWGISLNQFILLDFSGWNLIWDWLLNKLIRLLKIRFGIGLSLQWLLVPLIIISDWIIILFILIASLHNWFHWLTNGNLLIHWIWCW